MAELDLTSFRERLSAHGFRAVEPLAGGASSLTFRAERDGRPVVVKVAPPGHEPVGHRDVLRQARILDALRATDVPVPAVVWRDAGVPPVFAMSLVDGESFEPLFDSQQGSSKPDVAQRYRHAAAVLAALHRLAPDEHGAAGEPIVDAAAEVERWCASLRTVDPALAPGWSHTADALRSRVPDPLGPSLVHGDFRLGNLIADGHVVTAVIDWEIWSVGDPRIDLGWFLINADPDTYRRPSAYADVVPSRDELVSCYGDVPDVAWFMALACFKSTATWALIVKHNRRRSTPAAELEAMAPMLPHLLERANALVGIARRT